MGPRWRWLSVLGAGLLLWVVSVLVAGITQNLNLIPTVVLLGSFLVPVVAVVYYFDHQASRLLTAQRIFYTFVAGGVLGVLAASLLESLVVGGLLARLATVGLLEELAKFLALVVVSRGLAEYTRRDGIVLGATVGFGFAALESSGYALTALFSQQGLSLLSLVSTEVLRGVLSPVGHGLWGAILGGVVFGAAARTGRLHLTWGIVGTYLLVSLLHSLYDSVPPLALLVTIAASASSSLALAHGVVPGPMELHQAVVFLLSEASGIAVVSFVGVLVLWAVWRRSGIEPSAPA